MDFRSISSFLRETNSDPEVEIHKAGNPQALIDWYNAGADGQIDWGTPGDFQQCVAIAGKHLDNPEGFCQLRHMDATGEPAGKASGEVTKANTDTYTPPKEVRDAAAQALEWLKDGKAGDGFTPVGRKRASDLANGHAISLDTIKRMKAYFDRHGVDKQTPHWNEPSPGKVAWYAWGGDPGYAWAKRIVKEAEKVEKYGTPGHSGDLLHHAFHGNQFEWIGGMGGMEHLTGHKPKTESGGKPRTPRASTPKPKAEPKPEPKAEPKPEPKPEPKVEPKPAEAEKPKLSGREVFPGWFHQETSTVTNHNGTVNKCMVLQSANGNTVLLPPGSAASKWVESNPRVADIVAHFDQVAGGGKTLDLVSGTSVSNASGEMNPSDPNVIHLAQPQFFDKVTFNTQDAINGAFGSYRQASAAARDGATTDLQNVHSVTSTMYTDQTATAMSTINHELGHSDFYADGHTASDLYKPINDTLAAAGKPTVDFASENAKAVDDFISSASRKWGGIATSEGRMSWSEYRIWAKTSGGDGSVDNTDTVKQALASLGMTQYGQSTLQETVAEARAMYNNPKIPNTPLVESLAQTLGWTDKPLQTDLRKAAKKPSTRVIFTDTINGPMIQMDDGTWVPASPDLKDPVLGDIRQQEAKKELAKIAKRLSEIAKGDVEGHDFHGNQYESVFATASGNNEFHAFSTTKVVSDDGPLKGAGGVANKGLRIVTLDDGSKAVIKTYPKGSNGARMCSAEVLAAKVGQALGSPVNDCVRVPGTKNEVMSPLVEGKTFDESGSDASKTMQFFDQVVDNYDRNPGNGITTPEGQEVGIDHGAAFEDSSSRVMDEPDFSLIKPTAAGIVTMTEQLQSLKPDFEAEGFGDHFNAMMDAWNTGAMNYAMREGWPDDAFSKQ